MFLIDEEFNPSSWSELIEEMQEKVSTKGDKDSIEIL